MGKILQWLKDAIDYLEQLACKKNFGYFCAAITIIGVVMEIQDLHVAWWLVKQIGLIGMLVYSWKRDDFPQVLLFFALILSMYLL